MTTLVAWIVFTPTGDKPELPRAIYIASDSRISWGSKSHTWDAGRKLFSPTYEPHLFGYCGDVVFPSLMLGQISTAINRNVFFELNSTAEEKHAQFVNSIQKSFNRQFNAPNEGFSIVHAFRSNSWPSTEYHFWLVEFIAKSKSWTSTKVPIPNSTSTLISLGTGARGLKSEFTKWEKSASGGMSRAIFSAFCDNLSNGNDPLSGGPAQISALYSALPPQTIGVVKDRKFYLNGLEVLYRKSIHKMEWVDDLFQRINPKTMEPMHGSRKFIRPRIN